MKLRLNPALLRLCLLLSMLAFLDTGVRAAAPHTDAVPDAPSNARLYTYPAPTSIEIAWTDNSTDENSFTIERKIDGQPDTSFTPVGSAFAQNVAGTGDTVTFINTGLTSDTVYDYRVEALAADGTASTFSNTATGTTAPAAPINLTATAVAGTDNSIKLTWTDNALHTSYFRIYRSTDGVAYTNFTNVSGTPGKGSTQTYTDAGLDSAKTYYYEVTAQNDAGESARSNAANATTGAAVSAPAAPSVFGDTGTSGPTGADAPGTTAYVYVRDQSTNETGFTLERADPDDGVAYKSVATYPASPGTGADLGPLYDAGLLPDTEYDYKAFATNGRGVSPDSNVLRVYTVPAAPIGLSAAAVAGSDSSIKLAWTDNARHTSYFRIYRSTDGGVTYTNFTNVSGTAGKGNTATYTDSGLNDSTTYYYEVTAQNDAGESARSGAAFATTNGAQAAPAAPSVFGDTGTSGPTGADAPGTTAYVYVRDQSTNETGFTLERADPDDGVAYKSVATYPASPGTGADLGPLYDAGLLPDTEYDYKAFATNSAGNSSDSNILKVYTVPAAPIGLSAAAVAGSDSSIKLAWTDNARHTSYFRIYRSTDGVAYTNFTNVSGTPGKGSTQTYTDAGLDSAKTYYYEVTAQNDAGESARSNAANATTGAAVSAPAAPSVFGDTGTSGPTGADAPGTTAYVYVRDQSTNETGFTLERADPDDGVAYKSVATYPASPGTGADLGPLYDAGLLPDTEYDYKAFATNGRGVSPDSNVLRVYTVPAAPIGLTATAVDSADIRLVWTDNARHTSYFRIYRSTDGGVTYTNFTNVSGTAGKGNTATYTDSGLSVNTTYYYEVTAQNDAGESARSNAANATTLPNTAPGAPTDLQGTATTGPLQVDLSWLDNSNDEFGFVVEREDNDDLTPVFTALLGATAGAPTVGPQAGQGERVYYVDKGVAADTIYSYQVKAVNPVGSSAYTNIVSVVTAPTTPSNLAGHPVAGNSTQITLTWTDTAKHEAGFNVYHQAPGQTGFTLLGTAPASAGTGGTVTFTDIGLTVNATYNYYVTAVNAGGASAPTSTISVSTSPTDTVPPSTTLLTGPGAGATVCANSVTFTYTGLDNLTPVASLKYETKLDSGAWSAPSLSATTTLTGLTNGSHTFAVRAVDQAGNVDPNPPARTFIVDTAPPVISALSAGTPGQTTATITWTTDRPATTVVDYRVQGTTPWTTITNGSSGTAHTVTLSGLAPLTTYEYRVHSADACTEAVSAIQTFKTTGDITPPTTTITGGPAGGTTVCGSSVTFTVTGTDNQTPTGSLRYEYKLDGGAFSAPSASTTITLTGLADGLHTITIAAVDLAGNVDPNPPSRFFTISTAPPTISAVSAAPTGNGATITWTTNKAATTQVQYRVLGTTAWTSTTLASALVTFHSVTLSGLTLGTTYQYQVLSTDSCGDATTSPVGTFATANPAPTITGLSPASATAGGPSFTLTITGTGFLPGVSAVAFGGKSVATLPGATTTQLQVTVPASAILSAGSPAVTVTNPVPGGGSASLNFTVLPPKANVPPSVTLTAPQDGASQYAPANVTVSATASDSDGTVAQVEFFQNGVSIGVVKAAPYTVSVSGLAAGSYVFKAVATDNQGASTTSNTATVTLNLLPLGVTILMGPANNATVCSGTVTFTWAGRITPLPAAPLKFQTQLDGGAWSAASTATQQTLTGLAEGLHTFAVRVLNPDGSANGTPAGVSFFVNLTPPTLLANTVDARDTRATINWSTSKATTGFVEYGPTVGYGQQTAPDTNSNGAHQTQITGLTAQTVYHYRIHYTDGCHTVVSPDQTFTTVARLLPNLEVSGAAVPGSFAPLGTITLSWTVLNAGPGDALGSWTDTVYLSTKNTLDATATKLGDFPSVSPLIEFGTYAQNQNVTIPRLPAGPYYLLIQTNSANTTPETTTSDNTVALPVSVTALQDLVVTPSQTNLSLHVHQTVLGQLTLTDLSLNALVGLTATVVGAPSNVTVTVTPPASLQSLQSGTVLFSVVAADASTLSASPQIVLTSAGGATATATLNLNVIPPTPQLTVNPATLTSSMVRGGKTRLVNFTVTNTGDATAKSLTLSLPNVPWLTLPSDNASGDLAPGASAQLELQLNPSPTLPLGLYTGVLGLNGANTSVSIPFAFNCVSTAVGGLKVVAQDEFSFFADTHPNIAGAHVVLTDATTSVVVVDAYTGPDGTLAEPSVTEGDYDMDVSAPGHNPYHGTLHLIAGETNEIDPFLSRQFVTYTWSVVPVTLADQYTVSLDATFETHVPAPVVVVSPATLNLATLNYDSTGKAVVNYTFTDVGLIAAQDVNFSFTSDAFFTVTTSLKNIGTIPALTSVVVPVTIQKVGTTGSSRQGAARAAAPATLSSDCGDALAGVGGFSYLCGGLQTHPLYAALINQFLTEPGGCAILNFLEYVQAVNGPIGGPGSDYPIGGSSDVNGKSQSPTSITTSGPCSPTQVP